MHTYWYVEDLKFGTHAEIGLINYLETAPRSFAAVATGLDQGLAEGRRAVAHIVGRDPDQLGGMVDDLDGQRVTGPVCGPKQ